MIRCGISTPQTVRIAGTLFVTGAKVLVTLPDSDTPIVVTPISVTSTLITFSFVFAVCGDYTIQVTDETGSCDACASAPFTLTPTPVPCPDVRAPLTLGELRTATQHRLGDDAGVVWSAEEVTANLLEGYVRIATQFPVFWDQTYAENLPRGFSVTQPWEVAYLPDSGGFNYGVANFTAEFERQAGAASGFDTKTRSGPANHTSPFEATDGLLARAGSGAIPATSELPKTLTALDRVCWDNRVIDAVEPRSYARLDSRYETTTGPVEGYMWQKDGVRTLRKVRVPASQAATVTVNGSWGLLRRPADLSSDTVHGTWGIARRIPDQHPIGPELWGAPRRPYLDSLNVRVEHFRKGRALLADADVCELPARYARYLMDYAQACCLSRPGPGYDRALADHFDQRWQRGLARIARRVALVDTEHVFVMGGGSARTARPPRPSLPAAYGSRVR